MESLPALDRLSAREKDALFVVLSAEVRHLATHLRRGARGLTSFPAQPRTTTQSRGQVNYVDETAWYQHGVLA